MLDFIRKLVVEMERTLGRFGVVLPFPCAMGAQPLNQFVTDGLDFVVVGGLVAAVRLLVGAIDAGRGAGFVVCLELRDHVLALLHICVP